MSINNIQLKPNLLADLYKNCLIDTNSKQAADPKPVPYLGNNQKHILVGVSHTNVRFLPDEELNFLTNILSACKLSLADIGIINLFSANEADWQNLIQSEARTVLLFGLEPAAIALPINFPAFQIQQFNKCTYLHAPPLSEIESKKDLKAKLWNSLKALFDI